MSVVYGCLSLRMCIACFLLHLIFLLPGSLFAEATDQKPLRLLYLGSAAKGPACEQHAASPQPRGKKGKTGGGRPAPLFESEHRPVAKRTYYFNEHRRRAIIKAYIRRPNGEVVEPEIFLGYNPHVSFSTPFGDGPVHGPNSVYVVEQGVENSVLTIRSAKWITVHHNCGWGHDGKFEETLVNPQPLDIVPFEIMIDKLWDTNFHLSVASGDRLGITVLSYGKPVAGAVVTVSSEKGWSKRVVTDKKGKTAVQLIRDYYPPLWSSFKRTHRGEFLVTAQYESDQQGHFRNASYERVHYITTLPWQYSPSSRDYASYSYGLGLGVLGMTVSGFGVYIYRERRRKPYKGISFD